MIWKFKYKLIENKFVSFHLKKIYNITTIINGDFIQGIKDVFINIFFVGFLFFIPKLFEKEYYVLEI
jgi:hypothetical protein